MTENNNNQNLSNIGPMIAKNKLGKIVCRHAWTSFDIYPNGNVTPCCYLPRQVMGNIKSQSIQEIWNGEKFKFFREKMGKVGVGGTCSPCPVTLGMNHWESLAWYKDLNKDSEVYKNACLNEEEIWEGKTELESNIRRLKYTPRYACNLKCYHCCQDQYREHGVDELGKEVLEKVKKVIATLQIFNPFGGEPFIFPETYELLDEIKEKNLECQLYTTTNANAFTEQTIKYLKEANIGKIAVSIDGFTKETYEKYRKRGNWDLLIKNIEILNDIKKQKPFTLVFNATFNNETYKELPIFISLCKKYNAIGKPALMQRKRNHPIDFWRKYIKMSNEEVAEYIKLIDGCLEDKFLPADTVNSLNHMRTALKKQPNNEIKMFRQNIRLYLVKMLTKIKLYDLARFMYKKIK